VIRFAQVFWTLAAIDAALLAVLLVITLQSSAGQNDGGKQMGIFFFILLPGAVLVFAMLLFHFSGSVLVKSIALFVVVAPALWFAKQQIEDRVIDRRVEANRSGVGYFKSGPMRQMGAAVVAHDVATLMRVGPTVDVNEPGDNMTLMQLAVARPDAGISSGDELPVVRALLDLGGKPDAAMSAACHQRDSALLKILLDAGGNPNLNVRGDEPLVFEVMSSITPENFRLLAGHGLDLDAKSHGDPLLVQLSIYRRWDLLAIAIELGADLTATRLDGRNVAGELSAQIDEETRAGHDVPPALLHAQALLASKLQR
jgi:hypothetical protein